MNIIESPYMRAVTEAVETFTYGDLILHEWLDEAFNIEYPEVLTVELCKQIALEKLNAMDYFRRVLLTQHCMLLQNVFGYGYRIVHPSEQTDITMEAFVKDMNSALRKGEARLTYVNKSLMTRAEINSNTEARNKLAIIDIFSRKKLRE